MRAATLYFRSRSAEYSIAGLVIVTLLSWLGAQALLARPWSAPELNLIPVLLFAPLAAACMAGVSTRNPFGEIEEALSFPLPVLRFLHLASLLACACLLLSAAASGWSLPGAEMSMVRNVLGLSGISLIASRILGSGLSWTLPLAYVVAVQLTGQDINGNWALWAWPAHPVTSVWSNSIAITLLAIGMIAACFLKPFGLSARVQ